MLIMHIFKKALGYEQPGLMSLAKRTAIIDNKFGWSCRSINFFLNPQINTVC